MSGLVVVPVLLPLLAAGLCMLVGRSRTAQRIVALTALGASTITSIVVMVADWLAVASRWPSWLHTCTRPWP